MVALYRNKKDLYSPSLLRHIFILLSFLIVVLFILYVLWPGDFIYIYVFFIKIFY